MNLDQILAEIYGTGHYQILLTLLCAYYSALFQFSNYYYAFLFHKPDVIKCERASKLFYNDATGHYFQIARKLKKTNNDQCFWIDKNATNTLLKCEKWKFNDVYIKNNLVTENDLLCERAYLRSTLESIFLLAIVLGHVTVILTSNCARKKVFLSLLGLQCLANVSLGFVRNIWIVEFFIFTHSYTRSASYIAYTQVLEILPIRKRAKFANFFALNNAVGILSFTIAAYLLRDWSSIKLILPFFSLAFPLLFIYFPESPRQLILQNKTDKANGSHKRIALFNNKNGDSTAILQKLKIDINTLPKTVTVKESFYNSLKYSRVRKRLLMYTFFAGLAELCNYNFIFDLTFQANNIYLSFLTSGIANLLGILPSLFLTEKVSRKSVCIVLGTLCGMSMCATPLFRWSVMIRLISGTLSRLLLRSLLNLIDLYGVELLPTSIRDSCFNLALVYRASLVILAPLFQYFLNDDRTFQLYGILLIMTGILSYFVLPETRGCPLPQTVEDIHAEEELFVDENSNLLTL